MVGHISQEKSTPLAVLRGHNVGVTAIAQCQLDSNLYLVSGDEEGSLVVWDLGIFKKILHYSDLIKSRTQSLKVISLLISGVESKVLIAQSRNDGVHLFNLTESIRNKTTSLKPLVIYESYSALFSKCDAKNVDETRAILAHPSSIENHMVTLRLITDDAKTSLSGTAQRFNNKCQEKKCTLFDIALQKGSIDGQHLLSVAYEDGHLCLFSFNPDSTETIPVLNITGLKIDLIKDFDLGIGDFLSAYDVYLTNKDKIKFHAVCGSPLKQLTFLSCELNEAHMDTISDQVELAKKGVSAICIRPDHKLVAVACWNGTIRLYSTESRKLLATLSHQAKQVQSILFIEAHQYLMSGIESWPTPRPNSLANEETKYLLCCASIDGTIGILSVGFIVDDI